MGRALVLLVLLFCFTASGCLIKQAPDPNLRNANAPTGAATAEAQAKLQAYVSGVSRGLAPEVQEALRRIDGDSRRLLAIRGYLRGARDLGAKWAWSQEQIDAYRSTAEYQQASAEVEKVRRKFAELNPGYNLQVNTEVRSLDEQVSNWNEAEPVRRAGDELLAAALKEVSAGSYKPAPDAEGLERFERFLRAFSPAESPTVAVPGLSAHGQSRAFGFQVKQGDKLIAGTSSAGVKQEWDDAGWTAKLQEAVSTSSTKFNGPLESPREPWHYTYVP